MGTKVRAAVLGAAVAVPVLWDSGVWAGGATAITCTPRADEPGLDHLRVQCSSDAYDHLNDLGQNWLCVHTRRRKRGGGAYRLFAVRDGNGNRSRSSGHPITRAQRMHGCGETKKASDTCEHKKQQLVNNIERPRFHRTGGVGVWMH